MARKFIENYLHKVWNGKVKHDIEGEAYMCKCHSFIFLLQDNRSFLFVSCRWFLRKIKYDIAEFLFDRK